MLHSPKIGRGLHGKEHIYIYMMRKKVRFGCECSVSTLRQGIGAAGVDSALRQFHEKGSNDFEEEIKVND
jgi:hypothetical protein